MAKEQKECKYKKGLWVLPLIKYTTMEILIEEVNFKYWSGDDEMVTKLPVLWL